MFSAAPQRLARDATRAGGRRGRTRAISATVCSGSGTCSSTSIARRQLELAVGERQVLGLHDPVLEVRRLALGPLGLDRRVLEVDADDAAVAQALRPLVREHALAAADVEHRARRGLRQQLVERALEAGHQPLARPGSSEPYLS